jgi:hypothetical protein
MSLATSSPNIRTSGEEWRRSESNSTWALRNERVVGSRSARTSSRTSSPAASTVDECFTNTCRRCSIRRSRGPHGRRPHPGVVLSLWCVLLDRYSMIGPGDCHATVEHGLLATVDPCVHRPRHGWLRQRLSAEFQLERIKRTRLPRPHRPFRRTGSADTIEVIRVAFAGSQCPSRRRTISRWDKLAVAADVGIR